MTELKPCPFCGAVPETFVGKFREWGLVVHRDGCLFPTFPKHEIPKADFEAWNKRTHKLKKHKASDLYALYKHDELLAIGTAYELAEYMGIKLDTFYSYTYPSTQERMKKRKRGGIYVERIEE